jgi:activator of 2-hydroxyglutaryl-CoA dehydratase
MTQDARIQKRETNLHSAVAGYHVLACGQHSNRNIFSLAERIDRKIEMIIGLDIGSRAIKAVGWQNGQMLELGVTESGFDPREQFVRLLEQKPGISLLRPTHPDITGAVGAALHGVALSR